MRTERAVDLTIRGHHLLCMLGFRGEGYSDGFVRNMRRVVERFHSERALLVQLVDEPDDICSACPNLDAGRCTAREGADERTRCMDREVLAAVGLPVGGFCSPDTAMRRVTARMDEVTRRQICEGCRWLDRGYCRDGLRELKDRRLGTKSNKGG